MHLLVLSAFRPFKQVVTNDTALSSQCTFWCSVLSDRCGSGVNVHVLTVSMHLLVLSAFRRGLQLPD